MSRALGYFLKITKGMQFRGADRISSGRATRTGTISHVDAPLLRKQVGTIIMRTFFLNEGLFQRKEFFPFPSEVMHWPLRRLHRRGYTVHSVSLIECMPQGAGHGKVLSLTKCTLPSTLSVSPSLPHSPRAQQLARTHAHTQRRERECVCMLRYTQTHWQIAARIASLNAEVICNSRAAHNCG